VALAPEGRPDTDNETVCDEPEMVAVLTVALVPDPCCTEADVGETASEKSLPGAAPVTIGPEIAHPLVAFDHVACIAKDPVAKVTFWAPPVPPRPTHAHKSPFSYPFVLSHHPPPAFWSERVSAYS